MFKKCRRSDSGSVLVLTAIALPVLIGFAALALDVGYIYDYRLRMGAAADAAATSGAFEVKKNTSITQTALETQARNDAMRNGFMHGLNNITVTVTRGDFASGTFTPGSAASDKFVKVVVSRPVPTFLMGILGRSSMTVDASAIAGPGNANSGCVYALNTADPAYSIEFEVEDTVIINTPNCAVISNGNFAVASGSSITASEIDVTASSGSVSGTVTPAVNFNSVSADDPFSDMDQAGLFGTSWTCSWSGVKYVNGVGSPVPVSGTGAFSDTGLGLDHYVLEPGVYCGGITIKGGTINSSGSSSPLCVAGTDGLVTFNPGRYIVVGGVGLNWIHVCTAGTGVTFYLTGNGSFPYPACNDTKVFQSDPPARFELTAPTTGAYQGLLLIQDRTQGTSCTAKPYVVDFRPDAMIINGAIYYPNHHIRFGAATSSSGAYTILIGGTLDFTGNARLNSDFTTLSAGSPIKRTGIAQSP